ncbi:hypothetical protein AOC05_05085 [Arthrobacter alpinus]|uniref:Uncharacterized protein n=1 Tax=Arthrobacter alpinus TaxID=656366 RepID=A0A0M4QLP9_9MICC|nr:hypothetical protein [Arthrobacter alpinus]ALE91847.1 hypothetical protein AOC05_05085 [Arthrobacter alpinus]
MGLYPGDRVRWLTHGLEGTVLDDHSPDWPEFIGIQWDNGDRTFASPAHIRIQKKEDRDALAKEHVTVEENTPYKEQIHLQSSNNTTIPTGYQQAEPGSPVYMAPVTEGCGHHIYREFDRSTNAFQLHFELDLDRDMSPADAVKFAHNILRLAVPMQEDQLTRATGTVPGTTSWAETVHFDEETETFSGRGPGIQLKDGRQEWDIHSNWFEGGDEQFTLSKRYKDLDDPSEEADEYCSFDSREEVLQVMAGLVNLLAATSERAK